MMTAMSSVSDVAFLMADSRSAGSFAEQRWCSLEKALQRGSAGPLARSLRAWPKRPARRSKVALVLPAWEISAVC